MSKVILYELNEVPLRIIDYYIKMRPESWLAKHYSKLNKFETYSENKGHLSPWNTWPTLHRGVTNDKHFISDFNQDLSEVDKNYPTVWRVLAENKVKTGVFGSLHSYPPPESQGHYSFYVPDVFAAGKECFPKNVELFQDINLKLSRKSSRNVDSSIPYKDMLRLFGKIGSLGFKVNTMTDIGSHLLAERKNSWKTARRRTYQTVLAFDVFYKLLKKEKPDFVTFFTNHVASSQHRFWAAAFPSDYETFKFDKNWVETYENEIVWTMDKTDAMLMKLAKFVDQNPDYRLMITSSMGQEPIESEPIETQFYIVDYEKFFRMLGVTSSDFKFLPSMLPQFNFEVKDIKHTLSQLSELTINGAVIRYKDLGDSRISIDLGQQNLKKTVIALAGKEISVDETGLKNVLIEDKSNATAYHIPEGHCFIYHPSYQESDMQKEQLSTLDIMPTLLNNFGVMKPSYLNKGNAFLLK